MGIKKSVVSPGAIVKANSDLQSLAKSIGRVVNGNKSTTGASAGQFVVLLSSTISGRADGLYTAAKAIPANTAIDSSYLTASESGLNALNSKLTVKELSLTPRTTASDAVEVYTDQTFKNHPIVGYAFGGISSLAGSGLWILTMKSDNDGLTFAYKNLTGVSVTPSSIKLYYL